MGFIFRNPKLNPLKSLVGALESFLLPEPLLLDDPDELLLATEMCRGLVPTGAGAEASASSDVCVSGAL